MPTPINIWTLLPVIAAIVAELQKDLADGKITLDEGVNLADILAQNLVTFMPQFKPEADLVAAIAAAILAYEKAKPPTPVVTSGTKPSP